MQLPEIKEALLLRVQPGDAIVLRVERSIDRETADRLRAEWHRMWTGTALAGVPCVLLDGGADLTVVRREAADAAA
jgi:hypothetical protein